MPWILKPAGENAGDKAAFASQQAFQKYFVLHFHRISQSSFGMLTTPAIKHNQFCACSYTELVAVSLLLQSLPWKQSQYRGWFAGHCIS